MPLIVETIYRRLSVGVCFFVRFSQTLVIVIYCPILKEYVDDMILALLVDCLGNAHSSYIQFTMEQEDIS